MRRCTARDRARSRSPAARSCTLRRSSSVDARRARRPADARSAPRSSSSVPACARRGSKLTTTTSTSRRRPACFAVGEQLVVVDRVEAQRRSFAAAPDARGAPRSRVAISVAQAARVARGPRSAAGTSPSRGTPRCPARAACSRPARRPARRCRSCDDSVAASTNRASNIGRPPSCEVGVEDVGRVRPEVRAEELATGRSSSARSSTPSAPAAVLRHVKYV